MPRQIGCRIQIRCSHDYLERIALKCSKQVNYLSFYVICYVRVFGLVVIDAGCVQEKPFKSFILDPAYLFLVQVTLLFYFLKKSPPDSSRTYQTHRLFDTHTKLLGSFTRPHYFSKNPSGINIVFVKKKKKKLTYFLPNKPNNGAIPFVTQVFLFVPTIGSVMMNAGAGSRPDYHGRVTPYHALLECI